MSTDKRYQELADTIKDVKGAKKEFILSLIKDFVFLESQIDALRNYPRYIINPKDSTKQIKLPVHDLLKDYQAQKNDITTKILRALDFEDGEESPLVKALMRYEESN